MSSALNRLFKAMVIWTLFQQVGNMHLTILS